MQKRILVIEDDHALARIVTDNLTFEGFRVATAVDGNAAVNTARAFAPDLILLDLMLPDRDGSEVLGLLREGGKIPVIVVTARGRKADKLELLNLGADDYVTKPFDVDELLARIRAVLRRTRGSVDVVVLGHVTVDFQALRVDHATTDVRLTHREFEILRYLAERKGHVVARDELLREVWGYLDAPLTMRMVDHAMVRLRKKLEEDPPHPRFIHTVPGGGYCLTPSGATGR